MLIDKVKVANRITSTDEGLTDELKGLIDACLLDLQIAGVATKNVTVETQEPDALITRAVILYSKAHFGFDNPEAERFERAYLALKQHLSLSEDYKLEASP